MEHALDLMVPASKNLKVLWGDLCPPPLPPGGGPLGPLQTFQIFGCRVIPY